MSETMNITQNFAEYVIPPGFNLEPRSLMLISPSQGNRRLTLSFDRSRRIYRFQSDIGISEASPAPGAARPAPESGTELGLLGHHRGFLLLVYEVRFVRHPLVTVVGRLVARPDTFAVIRVRVPV